MIGVTVFTQFGLFFNIPRVKGILQANNKIYINMEISQFFTAAVSCLYGRNLLEVQNHCCKSESPRMSRNPLII